MFFENLKRFVALRLAPIGLIGGVVFSFLGCCFAGEILSARNPYTSFVRFHPFITPETLYSPTARQVISLAKSQLDPSKIVVIVGGSSILHGTGQREAEVWTKELQSQLGGEYQVINFALRSGVCCEFGGTAAEFLARDFPKLIYVADFRAPVEFDGEHYRYFHWDAYYKGLLHQTAVRQEWAKVLEEERRNDGAFVELRRQMKLDSFLSFHDCWTQFEYRIATTIWSPKLPHSFRSRRLRPDPELGTTVSFESRYAPARRAETMRTVRAMNNMARIPLIRDDLSGFKTLREVCDARKDDFRAWAELCFPEPFRGRTVLLVTQYSPYYVDHLEPAVHAEHQAAYSNVVNNLEACGFASMQIGGDYAVSDYSDFCHLSEAGGRRMAGEVAPRVRTMAERLGFAERQASD